MSAIGWAIVSMPSRITPTFWNSDDSDHMIQPVIAFSRSVSAEAAAMAPIVAAPCVQRTIAVPMTATIRKPLISVSPRSISVMIRICAMKVLRACSIASPA